MPWPGCCYVNQVSGCDNCCECCGPMTGNPKVMDLFSQVMGTPEVADPEAFVAACNFAQFGHSNRSVGKRMIKEEKRQRKADARDAKRRSRDGTAATNPSFNARWICSDPQPYCRNLPIRALDVEIYLFEHHKLSLWHAWFVHTSADSCCGHKLIGQLERWRLLHFRGP